MDRDTLWNLIDTLSFTAGMNLDYHQHEASSWAFWDTVVKVVVGILAVCTVWWELKPQTDFRIFPRIYRITTAPIIRHGSWLSLRSAILTAILAVVLSVIPMGDWSREHQGLFQRWTDLRSDVDQLKIVFSRTHPDDPRFDYISEMAESLMAKKHSIQSSEPYASWEELMPYWVAETKRRHGDLDDAQIDEMKKKATIDRHPLRTEPPGASADSG